MNATGSAWSGLEMRHLLALVAVVETGTFVVDPEGVIRFGNQAENRISITFDDGKTDEEKIVSDMIRPARTIWRPEPRVV